MKERERKGLSIVFYSSAKKKDKNGFRMICFVFVEERMKNMSQKQVFVK